MLKKYVYPTIQVIMLDTDGRNTLLDGSTEGGNPESGSGGGDGDPGRRGSKSEAKYYQLDYLFDDYE